MVSLKIVGLDRLDRRIRDIERREKDRTIHVLRGLAAAKLYTLIKNSPQWSGDFAANWLYTINRVDTSYETDIVPGQDDSNPFQQFSPQAIGVGLFRNLGRDSGLNFGDKIYLSNHSTHTNAKGNEDAYYKKILDGTLPLRDVNIRVSINAARQQYREKYAKKLTPRQVGYLKGLRAGDYRS